LPDVQAAQAPKRGEDGAAKRHEKDDGRPGKDTGGDKPRFDRKAYQRSLMRERRGRLRMAKEAETLARAIKAREAPSI